MLPKLVPACNTPAERRHGDRDQQREGRSAPGPWSRKTCCCATRSTAPSATRRASAGLQDYHFQYGQDERRADVRPFTSRRRDVGDVTLFVDRCILCSRCVRFTREISGTAELMVIRRGAHEEIDVLPGFPLNNKLSGNVVDLCPVGALGDKDFLYQQRVWFLRRHAGRVHRLRDGLLDLGRGEPGPHVADQAAGEPGGEQVVDLQRRPLRLSTTCTTAGAWSGRSGARAARRSTWTGSGLPGELAERLRKAGRLAAVLSPLLTVEEAYLLATLVRGIDPKALLALGPVPVGGRGRAVSRRFHDRGREVPQPPRRRGGAGPLRRQREDVRRVPGRGRRAGRSAARGSPADTRRDVDRRGDCRRAAKG